MISTLGEMGFSENRAKHALRATDYKGVEPAMEWLLTRTEDASLEEPPSSDEEEEEAPNDETPAEEKKPLTEEEKKEKMERLEELRKRKRAEREEKEKKEAQEKEKKRVIEGKGMTDIKAKMEEQEIRKLADLRRREKQEEKAAKAKILAQIEADKIARKEMFKPQGASASPAAPAAAASPSPAPAPVKKDYTDARLQIRQTNGQPIVHSFGVKEQLAAVRLYVEMNRTDGGTGPVKLMTNFPKRVFQEEDYENSLENLGLVPSAVLMVTK